jgi:hypothetical protein
MRNQHLVIFISHASEDRQLADLFRDLLGSLFNYSIEVASMSRFPLGSNWRASIDTSLDEADIFLIIATGREKLSHSFTGYEVGYFRSSLQRRRWIDQELERLVLPFTLGAETPDTVSDMQAINIHTSDAYFLDTASDSASTPNNDSPIVRLLLRIHDIVRKLQKVDDSAATQMGAVARFQEKAKDFYKEIKNLMSTLPDSTEYPKTRLTIRLPAGVSLQDFDISDRVSVKCDGPTQAILQGVQGSSLVPWPDFAKRLGDDTIQSMWSDAIESLVRSSSSGSFADSDQHVLSADWQKVFSLFAAKSVTFYDQSRELTVYVVETLRPKEVGDPFTTFLGKAIDVALRYRSLFLENLSPYSPRCFQYYQSREFKPNIKEMLRELRMLFKQSQEAHLGDAQYLARIYDGNNDTVNEFLRTRDTWLTQKSSLLLAAASALSETTDRGPLHGKFITVLTEFCEQAREMNKLYTNRILKQLASELGAGQ